MRTIFLLFDSLNRRALECYGGTVHTPNFKRLAQRCITYDNHFVGSLPCMPARRDMHTGRLNFLHRSWGPIEPFDTSFAELLKNDSTYAHLITDHYHYFEDGGLTYHNRFNTWELERGQEWDPWKALVKPPIDHFQKQYHSLQFDKPGTPGGRFQGMVNRNFIRKEEEYSMARCFERTFDFLKNNGDADNWFLQLECFDPHEPFSAPERFREIYPTDYQGPILDWPRYERVEETEQEINEIRANYAALVTMCDEYLGRLLDKFDEENFWRNTALIVTTDHGFMLAEHDWWAKSRMPFYNEIAHIPLLFYHPLHKNKSGERRSSLTQNMDIMPTILELHGKEIPDTVRGISLLPTLEENHSFRKAVIYGQFGAATNITNGHYTYFRYPENITDQEIYEYTLMPMHQQSFFAKEEFEGTQLVEGFGFMRGFPVLKLPARQHPNRGQGSRVEDTDTVLFDIKNDPDQRIPLQNKTVERELIEQMIALMLDHEAPPEAFGRLGLEP